MSDSYIPLLLSNSEPIILIKLVTKLNTPNYIYRSIIDIFNTYTNITVTKLKTIFVVGKVF